MNAEEIKEIEERMAVIQAIRVALLDKHGVFGGGVAVNAQFDKLNKEWDALESKLENQ
jgi:hypothetical protein